MLKVLFALIFFCLSFAWNFIHISSETCSLSWRILFFLENIIKWEIWVKLTKKGDIGRIWVHYLEYGYEISKIRDNVKYTRVVLFQVDIFDQLLKS